MAPPQLILLDAVGTLFGPRASIGELYRQQAAHHGVRVAAEPLQAAFARAFAAAPPLAFPHAPPEAIAPHEYRWWRAVTSSAFAQVGAREAFADFEAFFSQLYAFFGRAEPWYCYPEVRPALERWRQRGIALGVVSNFDSRLHAVLAALGMDALFDSVTVSSRVGAAKPNARIFWAALHWHGVPASRAWHVGDSLEADYRGAQACGLRAFWLQRSR
ncbi:MAG: hydrolase [Cyanobacteria bacterium QS_8_64_29]|nr:MAG: hydrolase [Cyanobacteria bacterium QS_8_64_29]